MSTETAIFDSGSSGGLRWRRPLVGIIYHGRIVILVPVVLWVLTANYGDNPVVLLGCLVAAGLFVLHVWSWRLELTTDGVILVRSLLYVTWEIDKSDVHAVLPNLRMRTGNSIVLLVGTRRKVLPVSPLLPAHYVEDMAEDLAAWVGCEIVGAEDFSRLRQARIGYPERGHPRTTTRDDDRQSAPQI